MKKTCYYFVCLLTVSGIACTCGGKEPAVVSPQSSSADNNAPQMPAPSTAPSIVAAADAPSGSGASCNRDLGKTECENLGGDFGPHGKGQMHFCNCPTADNGKACTDNGMCEGYCECSGPEDTEGRCSARVTRFGCFCKMTRGKPMRICRD